MQGKMTAAAAALAGVLAVGLMACANSQDTEAPGTDPNLVLEAATTLPDDTAPDDTTPDDTTPDDTTPVRPVTTVRPTTTLADPVLQKAADVLIEAITYRDDSLEIIAPDRKADPRTYCRESAALYLDVSTTLTKMTAPASAADALPMGALADARRFLSAIESLGSFYRDCAAVKTAAQAENFLASQKLAGIHALADAEEANLRESLRM